jgi:hypothetical protein
MPWLKALARAFRWRKMLDEDVTQRSRVWRRSKGIGKTYVSQVSADDVEESGDGGSPAG